MVVPTNSQHLHAVHKHVHVHCTFVCVLSRCILGTMCDNFCVWVFVDVKYVCQTPGAWIHASHSFYGYNAQIAKFSVYWEACLKGFAWFTHMYMYKCMLFRHFMVCTQIVCSLCVYMYKSKRCIPISLLLRALHHHYVMHETTEI